MRIRLLIAAAVLPLALWAALPLPSQSATPQQRIDDLQKKIESARGRIGKRKGTERVLTSEISAYTSKINRLEAHIGRLQRRQAEIQADLDAKRAELARAPARAALRARAASSACASAWPRAAPRSPNGWSSSTRPTSPTSSR